MREGVDESSGVGLDRGVPEGMGSPLLAFFDRRFSKTGYEHGEFAAISRGTGEDHPDHSAGLRQGTRTANTNLSVVAKTIPITQRD